MGSANHSQLSDKAVSGSEAPSERHAWLINSKAPPPSPPSAGCQSQGRRARRGSRPAAAKEPGWDLGSWRRSRPCPHSPAPAALPCSARDLSQGKRARAMPAEPPPLHLCMKTRHAGSPVIQGGEHEPPRQTAGSAAPSWLSDIPLLNLKPAACPSEPCFPHRSDGG